MVSQPEKALDDKKIEKYEKINHCVEIGSLVIGLGILAGTLTSAVIASPLPIYAGTGIGYGLAIEMCYKYFQRKHEPKVLGPCEKMYTEKDKLLERGCRKLPDVTEFSKECIQTKTKEAEEKDKKKTDEPPCKGDNRLIGLFKPSHKATCPCVTETADTTDGRQHVSDDHKEKFFARIQLMSFPLKRFTNPPELISPAEAENETYRSYPLKRFTNPKRVAPPSPEEN